MSKVLFLLKMLACISSLFSAWVVYLEVMHPFAEMALYRYGEVVIDTTTNVLGKFDPRSM
jgi:hypothetical protein